MGDAEGVVGWVEGIVNEDRRRPNGSNRSKEAPGENEMTLS